MTTEDTLPPEEAERRNTFIGLVLNNDAERHTWSDRTHLVTSEDEHRTGDHSFLLTAYRAAFFASNQFTNPLIMSQYQIDAGLSNEMPGRYPDALVYGRCVIDRFKHLVEAIRKDPVSHERDNRFKDKEIDGEAPTPTNPYVGTSYEERGKHLSLPLELLPADASHRLWAAMFHLRDNEERYQPASMPSEASTPLHTLLQKLDGRMPRPNCLHSAARSPTETWLATATALDEKQESGKTLLRAVGTMKQQLDDAKFLERMEKLHVPYAKQMGDFYGALVKLNAALTVNAPPSFNDRERSALMYGIELTDDTRNYLQAKVANNIGAQDWLDLNALRNITKETHSWLQEYAPQMRRVIERDQKRDAPSQGRG